MTTSDGPPTRSEASRPIRVLLLIKGLGRGGAEQLLVNAVERGDRDRFEYHVAYLLPWKDAFVEELEALGVPVTCLDGGGRTLAWVGRLRRLVRDRGIDIVHVHSPYVAAAARLGLPRRGPVLVTTEHNVWERYHRATYWSNAVSFPRNDHVFAVSDEVRDSVAYPRGLRFLRRPTVETVHHGIDVPRVAATRSVPGMREQLGVPTDALVIGNVANFKVHKGHEYLIRVAARMVRERADVRFVLVGQGPLFEASRELARRLGAADAVVFAGFREDALQVMRTFDILAMSSLHEGLPLALLEAMALGIPPVATRVGGVGAVIDDGVSGFIVEPRDPEIQADRLMKLVEDEGLRRRLGTASRVRAEAFDVGAAIHHIERVYTELVA